jgi:large subunit ribosomal protein L20
MTRARRGFKARRRHNRLLKRTRGYHWDRKTFRHAAETVKRALHFAYKGRKHLKQDIRALWITRINAALEGLDASYSKFMGKLKTKNCQLNRKMLAELAARDPEGFKAVYQTITT